MNELKFNSQICTTKEQSQRLLELGLSPYTSDMCWLNISDLPACAGYTVFKKAEDEYKLNITPAWSLHRLIEMFHENILITKSNYIVVDNIFDFDASGNLYDNLISAFQHFFPEQYLNE